MGNQHRILTAGGAALFLLAGVITGPTAAHADATPPLASYDFDETSGTVAHDSSGHGLDASLEGGATFTGGAVRLDGTSGYVQLPPNLLAGLSSVTVSAQVLIRLEQSTPYFIWGLGNQKDGAGNGYLYTTGDTYRASISSSNWTGEQTVGSGTALPRQRWVTISYTLDDATDTARLYLDGAQVAVQTGVTLKPSDIGGGATALDWIGRSMYSSDNFLAGSVRDFRLYGSALDSDAIAALQPTDAQRVARDSVELDAGDLSALTANVALPASAPNGSSVAWRSSDPAAITDAGVVTRPAAGSPDAHLTMTATLRSGSATATKEFSATVLALPSDQTIVDQAAAALTVPDADDVRGNITIPTADGVSIAWTSSAPAVVATDGTVTRGASDRDVTLTATVTHGTATATRRIDLHVVKAATIAPYVGYAFAYFTGDTTAGENIFFAASNGNNALSWHETNDGKPVLTSSQGTKGLRDPFLIRSPDGDTFYLLATDLSIGSGTSWDASQRTGSRYLEVWESHDLVNWSAQRHVLVSPPEAGNTWAPEAYWDASLGSYVVFWASKLYADDDPGHTANTYNRMLYSTTRDFVTFSTPKIWQDGVSRIDSTVISGDGGYYRFTKDEGAGTTGCSDIIQEYSTDLTASLPDWKTIATCIGKNAGTGAIEGPTAFRSNPGDVNGQTNYLFVDEYGGRGYIPLQSDSLAHPDWKVPASYSLPTHPRHGTVIPVTATELAALDAETGAPTPAPADKNGELLRYDFSKPLAAGTTAGTSIVHDETGNGQDGTVVGGATESEGVLQLDGVDDDVQLPNNLLAGVKNVTVEATVRIDKDQSGNYFIWGIGNTVNGAGSGYLFTTGDAYRTSLATGNWSTEQTATSGSPLPRDRWVHLAYMISGTTATIYLDGVRVGTTTLTNSPGDIGGGETSAAYIGRSLYDADNRMHGSVRDFAIYNRALSPAEVLAASGNTSALAEVTLADPKVLKVPAIVDQDAHTVVFAVKPGTRRAHLTPVFLTAKGVTARPASGTALDLRRPKTITLTAPGGAKTRWKVSSVEMRSPVLPGYNADPNIAVFGDTYYIYATSDGYPGWGGHDFSVWSSKNLVDWTESAKPILRLNGAAGDVPWASGNAWAPTIAERGGKYYFYFSGQDDALGRKAIGVAVASSPTGPFTAEAQPMITNGEAITSGQAIDPDVVKDPRTGRYYIFWGNGGPADGPLMAELGDDMVSVKPGTIQRVSGLTDFREGSFLVYRKGLYHFTYSIDDTGSPDYRVGYATATSIDGPWTYRGVVLQKRPELGILGTGHDSMINVPGTDDWYIAYHRLAIPGGDGTHREVTIDRVRFDPRTGLMEAVEPTLQSVEPQTVHTRRHCS